MSIDPHILQCGWGGELSAQELAYVMAALKRDPALRRAWGFRPSAKRIGADLIIYLAMHGNPDSEADNRKLVKAWRAGHRAPAHMPEPINRAAMGHFASEASRLTMPSPTPKPRQPFVERAPG